MTALRVGRRLASGFSLTERGWEGWHRSMSNTRRKDILSEILAEESERHDGSKYRKIANHKKTAQIVNQSPQKHHKMNIRLMNEMRSATSGAAKADPPGGRTLAGILSGDMRRWPAYQC